MKILLVNPPHPSIGSRIPREHLPPLGLLSLGGPLLDAGHRVKLLDAEFGPMSLDQIISQIRDYGPDAVLLGHSGSTSGHPSASRIVQAVRRSFPDAWIVYGGVFPTYHWAQIMQQEPGIDFIVRGEGEETIVRLVTALEQQQCLEKVPGIVFRAGTVPGQRRTSDAHSLLAEVKANSPAPVIRDLDACRVGWELIDHSRYTYYGKRRAVVVQFSRCRPYRCHYCGQHGFWRAWRHRDPAKFAARTGAIAPRGWRGTGQLRRRKPHGLPPGVAGVSGSAHLPPCSIDPDRHHPRERHRPGRRILHLYKRAGVARFLLGMESTDEATLQAIHKGSTKAIDREAIRLMRRHGIISMAARVAGFVQEKDGDYWRTLRQLLSYDPDQIQALYATPHSWTPFALQEAEHRVVQTDLSRWDYKHQVLESTHVPNWRVLLWVKLIEAVCQLRPRSLWRLLMHPSRSSAPECAGIPTLAGASGRMKLRTGSFTIAEPATAQRWRNFSKASGQRGQIGPLILPLTGPRRAAIIVAILRVILWLSKKLPRFEL